MQLVLLSGGSGKRLWPLSNSARSKQFLPLLSSKNGMESMVQRVVRQIHESKLTNNITLATNANQLDIILNQLEDTVSIVTEPERRDTFPAIALAASFLKFSKSCCDDEIVVVMPCDPYTDMGYFKAISAMVHCVNHDMAKLVLMGITPTYPSEKFGYIIPQKDSIIGHDDIQKVSYFSEKPSTEIAIKLLEENAYWNGGVFAFRLGYIMNIVRRYVSADNFEDIRNNYSLFPKISFDYEVVEKADSIAVVPFSGQWKDLGTWDSLTGELKSPCIGNVTIGDHCSNTHVINELPNPIYVDGVDNIVVAASYDGILVCGKSYAEDIKNGVESITNHPMYEERRWGAFSVLDKSISDSGYPCFVKRVFLSKGKSISYEARCSLSESYTFVNGQGILVIDGIEHKVNPGDSMTISYRHFYAIKALTSLTFIQVQYGDSTQTESSGIEWDWSE